jgi:multimeric flavodoxin WrbA
MMKVLAIISSPRKLGNCELMAKEISRRMPMEHELKLLRLCDFELRACTGCYRCLSEGKCVIGDDLGLILGAMSEADAFIVAAPAYFLGANAALKQLMDRGLSFYGIKDRLWGKPSVAIAVAGIEGKAGSTLLTVQVFLKSILSDIVASAVLYAALPGEVFFDDVGKKTAVRLACALSGEAPSEAEADAPACPLCGGDALQLRQNAAEALVHEAWLRQMKERLVAELPRIRKLREEYRGGDWIRP